MENMLREGPAAQCASSTALNTPAWHPKQVPFLFWVSRLSSRTGPLEGASKAWLGLNSHVPHAILCLSWMTWKSKQVPWPWFPKSSHIWETIKVPLWEVSMAPRAYGSGEKGHSWFRSWREKEAILVSSLGPGRGDCKEDRSGTGRDL